MHLTNETITAPASEVRHDGEHLFWSENPTESLRISIRQLGQTTPVLAQETYGGLELVAGHARLAALTELGEPVLARLISGADAVDKGILYLTDNGLRPLDDGMRLRALRYFKPLMDGDRLAVEIFPLLGVKPKSKDARLLQAWLDLPANWQALLDSGHVPLAAGESLLRMSEADRNAVEPLFSTLSWSRSNAVNMLTWLFEAGKMSAKPIGDVMNSAGLNDIVAQGLSPKDGIARLTTAMKAARYPELSRLQDDFAKAAKELTAGTRWRMNQPNNFETGGAELTVQIKDAGQLERAVRELETMAGMSPWKTLWKLGGQHD